MASSRVGVVKKVIHVPTMTVQIIKEVPLESAKRKRELMNTLELWRNKLNNYQKLVPMYLNLWNQPEGYLSLVTEYLGGGSLENLLKMCGFLKEDDIRSIVRGTAKALEHIHLAGHYQGSMRPSQILFGTNGAIKLNNGLSPIIDNTIELRAKQSEDIFNLGKILMCCILGEHHFFGRTFSFDLPDLRDPTSNVGCMLRMRQVSDNLFNLIEECFLGGREIGFFIKHPFLSSDISASARSKVSITDLLKISNGWTQVCAHEYSESQLTKICEIVDVILRNNTSW